jgi:hypothetical protein
LKADRAAHNLVGNFKLIVTHMSYYQMRTLLGGRIPAYVATRWLSIFNGITFIQRKENLIRNIYPMNDLPLLNDLFVLEKQLHH